MPKVYTGDVTLVMAYRLSYTIGPNEKGNVYYTKNAEFDDNSEAVKGKTIPSGCRKFIEKSVNKKFFTNVFTRPQNRDEGIIFDIYDFILDNDNIKFRYIAYETMDRKSDINIEALIAMNIDSLYYYRIQNMDDSSCNPYFCSYEILDITSEPHSLNL